MSYIVPDYPQWRSEEGNPDRSFYEGILITIDPDSGEVEEGDSWWEIRGSLAGYAVKVEGGVSGTTDAAVVREQAAKVARRLYRAGLRAKDDTQGDPGLWMQNLRPVGVAR